MLNLLRISISMGVPIVLLLLCGRWLNRRFRAELKYVLWLVIALRLMVPVSVSLPEGLAQVPVLQRAGTVERQIVQRIQPESQAASDTSAAPAPAVPDRPTAAAEPTPAPAASGPSISQVLFWVWLTGFVLFLSYHLLANYHFRRKLRRWHRPLRDPRIRSLVSAVQEEMGVRQRVQVIRWEGTASPLVTGVLFPVLVLPERNLDDVSFYYVLRHEMTHIKRHDIAYQLLLLLACSIHWFNPLVHMMRIQVLHDMEVSCDARAIRGASRDDRVTYSEALLTTAISAANSPAMLSTAFLDSKKSLKLRFREILASSGKLRRGILVLAAVLALAVLCGFTVASQEETEPAVQPSVLEEPEVSFSTPVSDPGADSAPSALEDIPEATSPDSAEEPAPEVPAEEPTAVPSQPPLDEAETDPLRAESAISVEGVRFGMDDTDVIALLGEPDSREDYETVGGHIRQLFYFGGVLYAFQQCDTCGAYHLWSISTSDAAGEHMPLGIDTGDLVYEVLETLGVPEAEPTYRENLYTIDATHYATYHSLDDNPQLEFIHIFIGNVDWELAFGRQHQIYINNIKIEDTTNLHWLHTRFASSFP